MADRETRGGRQPIRTLEDVERAVKSISRHFKTDVVHIVGSQDALLSIARAPIHYRLSQEIDLYPANAREWELANDGFEASEEVNALFGDRTPFAESFGFYIDGVGENTAKLPADWRERTVSRVVDDEGRAIRVIAPGLVDLAVSKLFAFREKDKIFVGHLVADGHATAEAIAAAFETIDVDPDKRAVVLAFLKSLPPPQRAPSKLG